MPPKSGHPAKKAATSSNPPASTPTTTPTTEAPASMKPAASTAVYTPLLPSQKREFLLAQESALPDPVRFMLSQQPKNTPANAPQPATTTTTTTEVTFSTTILSSERKTGSNCATPGNGQPQPIMTGSIIVNSKSGGGGHGHSHGPGGHSHAHGGSGVNGQGAHGHSHGGQVCSNPNHNHGGGGATQHSHQHHYSTATTTTSPGGTTSLSLNIEPGPSTIPYDEAILAGFIQKLNDKTSSVSRLEGLRGIRRMTCADRTPPLQQVIDTGIVPTVIASLDDDDPMIQFEAAWVLLNVASGPQKIAKYMVKALPRLIELVNSPHIDLAEQAIWTLGNYAGTNVETRDEVIALGAISPILKKMDPNHKIPWLRTASWSISNLTRGQPPVALVHVKEVLPVVYRLLNAVTDEAVLTDCLWATSFITDDTTPNSDKLDCIIGIEGFIPKIVSYLRHPVFQIQNASLRIVGNIASGSDAQAQHLMNANILHHLLALMVSPKKGLRKESCWAMSNLAAGHRDHVNAIIESGILPPLVKILENESFALQKEAAWCISNITTNASPHLLMHLIRPPLDVVPPLMDLFTCPGANESVNQVVLTCIQNLLRIAQSQVVGHGPHKVAINPVITQIHSAGGPELIYRLQVGLSADNAITKLTDAILKEFFPHFNREPYKNKPLESALSTAQVKLTTTTSPPPPTQSSPTSSTTSSTSPSSSMSNTIANMLTSAMRSVGLPEPTILSQLD